MTEVVKSSDALTSIIGRTPESALTVFCFAVSSIFKDLILITLFKAFAINASVSISTLT